MHARRVVTVAHGMVAILHRRVLKCRTRGSQQWVWFAFMQCRTNLGRTWNLCKRADTLSNMARASGRMSQKAQSLVVGREAVFPKWPHHPHPPRLVGPNGRRRPPKTPKQHKRRTRCTANHQRRTSEGQDTSQTPKRRNPNRR